MQTASAGPPHRAASACGGLALIACLAVVHATPNDAFWVVDAGSKALLAQRLLESGYTSLDFEYPAAHLDPQGLAFPIPPPYAVRHGDGFATQYPVAYPALAAPFLALLGPPGLRVPAAIGVAACAWLFVLWLAPAVGRAWAAGGGAALALATPLFFYGVTVWEHSLTVALSLGAWTLLARRSRRRLALAGLLIGLACWLRAELALMGAALALACCARERSATPGLWLTAGALPAAAVWLAFNAAVYGDPRGVHLLGNVGTAAQIPGPGMIVARASALLGAFGGSPAEGALLGVATVGCLLAGFAVAWRERATAAATGVGLALGIAASLYGSIQTASARVPWIALAYYNGFLVRLPAIALAGVGAGRVWRRPEYESLRLGAGAGLLFLALALALRVSLTDFMTGGHWGPRMLLPAVPALAALALVALRAECAGAARGRARWAVAGAIALVLAGLVATGVSIRILDAQKREVRRLQQALLDAPQPVIVTNYTPLAQQLAAIWGRKPMLLASSEPALTRIVASLGRAGVESFLFVQRPPTGREIGALAGARCRLERRHRGESAPYVLDVDLHACRIEPAPRR